MKRRLASIPRMDRYVPLIREFAARDELFHDAVARRIGLHPTDEKVLRLLGENAMTAGDLVAYTGLTGAAVTALVDRLESLGYVTRERDRNDRRRVTIRAVGARLRDINRLYKGLHDAMEVLLSQYEGAEFAVIADYLTRATHVLAEQTMKLGGEGPTPKAKAG
jgi:MarR family transcriptional regulator, organic hydroperoxide resistance regulator